MKTLLIRVDKDSSFRRLMELARKLHLKTKVFRTEEKEDDKEEWLNFSIQNFSHAYSQEEPDYSGYAVKEPNPNYIPWKKEK